MMAIDYTESWETGDPTWHEEALGSGMTHNEAAYQDDLIAWSSTTGFNQNVLSRILMSSIGETAQDGDYALKQVVDPVLSFGSFLVTPTPTKFDDFPIDISGFDTSVNPLAFFVDVETDISASIYVGTFTTQSSLTQVFLSILTYDSNGDFVDSDEHTVTDKNTSLGWTQLTTGLTVPANHFLAISLGSSVETSAAVTIYWDLLEVVGVENPTVDSSIDVQPRGFRFPYKWRLT